MVDDTCYFVGTDDSAEAALLHELFNADVTQRFLGAVVFAGAKRPITADVLNRLDVKKLAECLGQEEALAAFLREGTVESNGQGLLVFAPSAQYGGASPDLDRSGRTW